MIYTLKVMYALPCTYFVVQLLSYVQTICDPMDCITPGFPVFHYLLEFAQGCLFNDYLLNLGAKPCAHC